MEVILHPTYSFNSPLSSQSKQLISPSLVFFHYHVTSNNEIVVNPRHNHYQNIWCPVKVETQVRIATFHIHVFHAITCFFTLSTVQFKHTCPMHKKHYSTIAHNICEIIVNKHFILAKPSESLYALSRQKIATLNGKHLALFYFVAHFKLNVSRALHLYSLLAATPRSIDSQRTKE